MIFGEADILLPSGIDMKRWSVIACDQYTSEPSYWDEVRKFVGESPSTLNLIIPEAEIPKSDTDFENKINDIHKNMDEYLAKGILDEIKNSYVYTIRTTKDGQKRIGLIGCIDLEEYDYQKGANKKIKASEETVIERIPPRVRVRDGAKLEIPHVILYMNDAKNMILDAAGKSKTAENLLYDFDLMMNAGHIEGYKISGELSSEIDLKFKEYYKMMDEKNMPYFAVGDGNHSLAAAKRCYEMAKEIDNDADKKSIRYALVELVNIYDKSQVFHPIHRFMGNVDAGDFIFFLEDKIKSINEKNDGQSDFEFTLKTKEKEQKYFLKAKSSGMAIIYIQQIIDEYLKERKAVVDYIHGEDSLKDLIKTENDIGIFMPLVNKESFFDDIVNMGGYCRKAFSIGEADDKRFYLETRQI